ncbi:MAG: tetratricopeptide repeat-containing sensor histidine kinase [Cyclobacteriaceae bacterium]
MSKWILFFILYCGCLCHGYSETTTKRSQATVDALISDSARLEIMNQRVEKYLRKHPDSAIYLAKSLYDSAQSRTLYYQQVNALLHMGSAYIYQGDYEHGDENFLKALEIAQEIAWSSGEAKVLLQLGNLRSRQARYDEALAYSMKSQDLFSELGDRQGIVDCLNGIGIAYKFQGKYREALDSYSKSLKICQEMDNKRSIMALLNNIANIHYELGETVKVVEYLTHSLELAEVLEHKPAMTAMLNNLGLIHIEEEKYERALDYLQRSFEVSKGLDLKKANAARLGNLGLLYFNLEEYDRALEYDRQGLRLYEEVGYKPGIVNMLLQMANLSIDLGEKASRNGLTNDAAKHYSVASQHGERALELAKQIGSLKMVSESSQALYQAYKGLNDPKQALDMYELHIEHRDSLNSDENERALIRLEYQYEYDKKAVADSIRSLNERNVAGALLSKEKTENQLLILFIVFLTILVGVVVWVYLRKVRDGQRLLLLHQEVSQQKEELENLNREKNGLIAIIGHDLRSPLTSVKGLVQLIISGKNRSHEQTITEQIDHSVDRMIDMVDRILDLSTLESKSLNLRMEPVELSKVTREVMTELEDLTSNKNQQLILEASEEIDAHTDRNFLFQVLENLITNAIKYSPKGADINIGLTQNVSHFQVTIRDQGPGISADEADQLFKPFAMISSQVTAGETSTGLGLSIAKKLVEAMGGRIWCDSKPGVGSTFGFEIPKG